MVSGFKARYRMVSDLNHSPASLFKEVFQQPPTSNTMHIVEYWAHP